MQLLKIGKGQEIVCMCVIVFCAVCMCVVDLLEVVAKRSVGMLCTVIRCDHCCCLLLAAI